MSEIKKCPICYCEGKVIKTVFGYGVECVKNGHLHNIGIFETEDKAVAAWNFWVGNVETPIV